MTKLDYVKRIEFFGSMSQADLVPIVDRFTEVCFPADAVVFHEGQPGDSLYYIVSGRVEALREKDGVPVRIGEKGPGECFGFKSILLQKPRTATMRAAEPSVMLRIARNDFFEILRGRPHILARMVQFLVQRNYFKDQIPKKSSQVYTFFSPKGGVGTSTLARNFGYALAAHAGARTLLVDFGFENGDLAHFFPAARRDVFPGILEAPTDIDRFIRLLEPSNHSGNLHILPAPEQLGAGVALANGISYPLLFKVFAKLRDQFRYIVVDLPAGVGEASLFSLLHAERNFLVANTEFATVRKVTAFLKGMRELRLPPEFPAVPAAILDKTTVVLNGYDPDSALSTTDLSRAFGREVVVVLPVLPGLRHRTDERPFFLKDAPGSELSLKFIKLINTLTPETIPIDQRGSVIDQVREWFARRNSDEAPVPGRSNPCDPGGSGEASCAAEDPPG